MYLIREPPKYMRQKSYKNDPKIGNASIVEDFNLMFIMDRTTREKINSNWMFQVTQWVPKTVDSTMAYRYCFFLNMHIYNLGTVSN